MKPVGYTFLNQYYKLLLPKLGVEVYQDPKTEVETIISYGGFKRKLLPKNRRNLDTPYENMAAAIKYQGIRLHFFAAMFKVIDVEEFTSFIGSRPNSKTNRVLWFLYEWLMGEQLSLADLSAGNYVDLFDNQYYFTIQNGERDRRTRIINNAIGTREFCPTVRKTPEVIEFSKINVYETAFAEVQKLGEALSADVIGRSINYLYTKETKSSTEIEKEKPDKQKMQRFLNVIKNAGLFELSKEKLIDLQNQIVEEKFKAKDYRDCEIYVGSIIQRYGFADQDVHYVGARAKTVGSMMTGLFSTHEKLMLDAEVPALIHAAIISFGEVFIHPFDDGNGRIHRYLIHDVLKQREPDHRFIIPISAAILKNTARYDQVLEEISKPILAMLDWVLDSENGNRVIINNDIDFMYRFPDYTEHVKFVYEMMNAAIAEDLIEEICLLFVFDLIKKAINNIADIPNMKLDTIISIIINGGGKVSKAKSTLILQYLTEQQITEIENIAIKLINEMKEKFEIDVQKLVSAI